MLILASLLGLNLTSFAFGCGPFIQHDQNRFCRSEFGENLTNIILFFYNFICIPYFGENQANIILLFYHSTYIRYTYTSFFEWYLSMKVHRLILGFFSAFTGFVLQSTEREMESVFLIQLTSNLDRIVLLSLFIEFFFLSLLTVIVVCEIIHRPAN